jgi:hypothetical protein
VVHNLRNVVRKTIWRVLAVASQVPTSSLHVVVCELTMAMVPSRLMFSSVDMTMEGWEYNTYM